MPDFTVRVFAAAGMRAGKEGREVPRLRQSRSALPRGFGMLMAACAIFAGVDAAAQTPVPAYANPLQPQPDGDPKKPERFQKFKRPAPNASGAPTTFAPPASGAGQTGFDSTNAKKKKAAKSKSNARTGAPSATVVPPTPASVSPYQRPQLPPAAVTAMAAGVPGAPPVALGPNQTVPKKRKPKPKDQLDPYDPLGIHAGAFYLYPAIDLTGGYDSNPDRSRIATGSMLYSVAPELRVRSDWSRHELKADLRGSYTWYKDDSTPSLNRPYTDAKITGRVDVTKNTRIDLGSRLQISTDNPGSPNLSAGLSKLPVYTTFGGDGGVSHRFNRLELGIKGSAERTVWQDASLIDGTTASTNDRNYNQYGGTLRAGYDLSPGVMPFVEAGADTRVHDLQTDFSGYRRDSKGLTGKAGSTFELSRHLTGEIAAGYLRRDYEDSRLEGLHGAIADASLIWTASALTTVKLTAKSTVAESTQAGISGVFYRDAGLQIDHALRRWLIGTVKAGFGLDDYVGSQREDRRYSAGAGLTYKLNRAVQIKGEFRQEWLRSNVTGNDYTASIFLVGLRFQY